AAFLEHHADAGPQPDGVALRVEAEDADAAGVRTSQAFAALDGGRLAGAVGAEDGGDGARGGGEGQTVDDVPAPVALDETLDLERRVGHMRSVGSGPPSLLRDHANQSD